MKSCYQIHSTYLGIPYDWKYKQLPMGLSSFTIRLNTTSFKMAMIPSTTNLVAGTKLPVDKNSTKYNKAAAYGINEYATANTVNNECGDVAFSLLSGSDDPAIETSM